MDEDKLWLRAPCNHDWWFGPTTDRLMRYRPALCVRCWDYRPVMELTFFPEVKIWGEDQYKQYRDEIEERFG